MEYSPIPRHCDTREPPACGALGGSAAEYWSERVYTPLFALVGGGAVFQKDLAGAPHGTIFTISVNVLQRVREM